MKKLSAGYSPPHRRTFTKPHPTKGRIALRSLLLITVFDFFAPEELQAIVEARA